MQFFVSIFLFTGTFCVNQGYWKLGSHIQENRIRKKEVQKLFWETNQICDKIQVTFQFFHSNMWASKLFAFKIVSAPFFHLQPLNLQTSNVKGLGCGVIIEWVTNSTFTTSHYNALLFCGGSVNKVLQKPNPRASQ